MSEIKTNKISSLDSSNSDITLDPDGTGDTIIASGNVGIGTTSPGANIEVSSANPNIDVSDTGTSHASQDFLTNSDAVRATIGVERSSGGGLFVGSSAYAAVFGTASSGSTQFATNNNVRMTIDSNGRTGINDTTPDSMLKVQSSANVTGNAQLTYFYDDQNRIGNYRQAAHASFATSMTLMYSNRSQSSAFNFLLMGSGGAADNEFKFRGDGQAYADGSFNGGGADYAEYFEWSDGNSSNEDRRGYSVVLVGNKIRKATSSDAAADIIGVVSAMPAVTGDAAWDRWEGKYLTDDYGSYLKETYTTTQWTDTDADGVETPHYYETDKIPADVTVPSDAVITSTEEDGSLLMRRRLNPNYDDTQTYVPREERQEWDTIGLMGKLRLRAGQPTGDRWIKMRDVATDDDGNVTIEEWLVR